MATSSAILAGHLGIGGNGREEDVLRVLVELGTQVIGAEEGSILVLDAKRRDLVFAVTVGSRDSERTLVGQRVPLGKGITGLAAVTREVQVGHPTFKDIRQRVRAAGSEGHPSAVLAAPMLVQETLIGVITAVSFEPRKRFGSADMTLFARIASIAGVVVEQGRQLGLAGTLRKSAHGAAGGRLEGALKRLERVAPGRQEQVASLLDAVAALVTDRPRA